MTPLLPTLRSSTAQVSGLSFACSYARLAAMRSHFRTRLPLLVIFLLGLALRLYRLGADSLWYDETVSVALAGSPLPELLRHTAGDIHPPGYYILLRGWLLLTGYPTGHADPRGIGLEFAAGFFSLFFGVLLIALVYALARRVAGSRVALLAAALTAFSPYNIWYSQEVRMYTLGAALGGVVLYALLNGTDSGRGRARTSADDKFSPRLSAFIRVPAFWWVIYALAAATGMYTLYYFAFLLIPLNLWALWRMLAGVRGQGSRVRGANLQSQTSNLQPLILANLTAALLYAPWISVAWRQATNPPVPPWRAAPDILAAVRESWTALSLGQSAPAWLWPMLLMTLALYITGLIALSGKHRTSHIPHSTFHRRHSTFTILPLATFGPLALILLVSPVTPLYHVRYLFTYSPAFYVVLAAGLAKIAFPASAFIRVHPRPIFFVIFSIWLAAAGVTLRAFWSDPVYRADDHRAAVHFLQAHWRPGDVVLVNAGWAYTALTTYWDGPVAVRTRLTDDLPAPGDDGAPVIITTGHVDGDPGLGWADPRSDFFALPAATAQAQIATLFDRFDRVWQYRIYDTVNDPAGRIRAWLAEDGQVTADQTFTGEANMRVQGFLSRQSRAADLSWPATTFASKLSVRSGPLPGQIASGETLYPTLDWQFLAAPIDFATSLRLIGPDGSTWAQGVDEQPAGPNFPAGQWGVGQLVRQTLMLPIPQGTPPGAYSIELVVYDPATGQPWAAQADDFALTSNGVRLGEVTVMRTTEVVTTNRALARFGPLALLEANSPATTIAAGGQIPVTLLWQAADAPGEPLVVVVQLQDAAGAVVAGLEEEPAGGRYPTQAWAAGELVRDRHTLAVPAALAAGQYQLIIGVYRAGDRMRLTTRSRPFGTRDHWAMKIVQVEGRTP